MRTQQYRTFNKYNLQICDVFDCDEDGWPIVRPSHVTPRKMETFQVKGPESRGCGHFFIDDYRFERLWNNPERYIATLRKYKAVCAPDFSMYTDMPYPMQLWNSYRSKALAHYWQSHGIEVIPTLNWSDERSFEFAFKGWPMRSTVAVSTVGVIRSQKAMSLFVQGLTFAVSCLRPECVIIYGKNPNVNLGVRVIHVNSDNSERIKKTIGKRQ